MHMKYVTTLNSKLRFVIFHVYCTKKISVLTVDNLKLKINCLVQ